MNSTNYSTLSACLRPLAKLVGTWELEHHVTKPSVQTIPKIAKSLGVLMEDLVK